MSIDDFEPLTAEERELAAKLGFGKRTYAPSPDIEQAIRAEAHRVMHHTDHKARPWGWLQYGGIAAACVLALGVAWKTLKTPHPNEMDGFRSTTSQSAEVSRPANAPQETTVDRAVATESVMPDTSNKSVSVTAVPAERVEHDDARSRTTTTEKPMEVAEASQAPEAPVIAAEVRADVATQAAEADASRAAGMQAKQHPTTSATPQIDTANAARRANEAAADSSATERVLSRTTSDTSAARPAPPRAAPAASPQAVPAPAPVASPAPVQPTTTASDKAVTLENGFDPRPPKTTDAQDVQIAWLKRIRALMQAGKKEEAAASLEAWRKRYPEATVPADLAPLGKVNPEQ